MTFVAKTKYIKPNENNPCLLIRNQRKRIDSNKQFIFEIEKCIHF